MRATANVFTLIQEFHTEKRATYPKLSERSDIIVIADEAHRSQYDTYATNMRTALPNAAFIAFTGTPLLVGEEKTREVFGDYVSVYDFQQSVQDGATVPLYYENRIPELQVTNMRLNEDMGDLLDSADLDDEQQRKLEREFAHEYQLITRSDRLDAVAKDIVEHFVARGFQGKAMVVSIDKATAVSMYDRVRRYWNEHISGLEAQRTETIDVVERANFDDLIEYMRGTDMAVVVSQGQNEVADLAKRGLDILPHRKRMLNERMADKFKDKADPLRLVFVCAMWMTGFDVPSCSTIYLDKPMRNQSLMQTIARANRVFPDKVNGLIVDYIGVFRNLQQALAVYGKGGAGEASEGDRPAMDKAAQVADLALAIADARAFLSEHGVDLGAILEAKGFDRQRLIGDAADAMLVTGEVKDRYFAHAALVDRLFRAAQPHPAVNAMGRSGLRSGSSPWPCGHNYPRPTSSMSLRRSRSSSTGLSHGRPTSCRRARATRWETGALSTTPSGCSTSATSTSMRFVQRSPVAANTWRPRNCAPSSPCGSSRWLNSMASGWTTWRSSRS